MQKGTLKDPITGESTVCKIARGNKKTTQVYHIPLAFEVLNKLEKMKRYPFIVETDKDTFLLWATSGEHYSKNFDRMHVRYLDTLAYSEHLEKILNADQ